MFNPRERHFSVVDLATNWNMSQDMIRRLFTNEPGVIRISRKTSTHERPPRHTGRGRPREWCMLRIPESVAQRVYERLTRGGR
jgi:hypothetical protein